MVFTLDTRLKHHATVFQLPDLVAVAESFAQNQLGDYVARLNGRDEKLESKEINDALWGTVSLSAVEVAVLDSPLFQRLRYVRQLGVVHWIYPGAMHTRFEHSLGVMQQVQLLAATINDIGRRKKMGTLIQPRDAQLLRLAALLHDVGHAAFSHVSEMAVQDLPALASLGTKFAREQRSELKSLSEMFAYYVVRSKAMKAFFGVLHDHYGTSMPAEGTRTEAIDEMVLKISNAIIGKMIDARVPLLHELISGPFDADKLDYFVRDARMAGTPSVLDISRLLQKISVVELSSLELPKELAKSVQHQSGKHCVFGIKWSGIPTLDELQLARVLLYAKIYRHPKVIGVEQMIRSAITTVAPLADVKRLLTFLYDHDDDIILAMDAAGLCKALGRDLCQLTRSARTAPPRY